MTRAPYGNQFAPAQHGPVPNWFHPWAANAVKFRGPWDAGYYRFMMRALAYVPVVREPD